MEPTRGTNDRLSAAVSAISISWLIAVAILDLVLPKTVVPEHAVRRRATDRL